MALAVTPEQLEGRMRLSKTLRQQLENEATQTEETGFPTTIWQTIQSFIPNINHRYTIYNNPIVLFEIDMHDLWYKLMLAGKVTDANDVAQDRLVSMILYARELGTLSRTTTVGDGEPSEEAVTEEGTRIWTDLPYCVRDFRDEWLKSMDLSVKRRANLAALTARMAAVGIGGNDLTANALWLFREMLEIPRRLTRVDLGDEVPVEELLPACFPWLRLCGPKLVKLSFNNHTFPNLDPQLTEPGELARKANIKDPGFSIDRWVFWRQRLKELGRCEHAQLAEGARGLYKNMIRQGLEAGVKIPGEAEYEKRVHAFMQQKIEKFGFGERNMVTSEGFSIYSDED
ncbi:uncharacterized protein PAC_02703 [Phialocephala subalpina]|uniref:Uncharacterized protein n=1 Tax=Phialocephala subalpina TaxID=576137 RepID=A0A1L7WJ95_9HELO|nr:uncharacterized protein PAC_02703 [Phialocephala subalpina]